MWAAVGWGSGGPSHCAELAEPGLPQRGQKSAFPPVPVDFLIARNDPRAGRKDLEKYEARWGWGAGGWPGNRKREESVKKCYKGN